MSKPIRKEIDDLTEIVKNEDHDPIIAFDESGNTGADLLDMNQPVFILASVRLSKNQTSQLKSIINSSGDELKFNRLKKYYKYHSQIIALLNSSIISPDTVRISVFHKSYCICALTVDRLIETVAYKDGIDFYKNGLNISYTNLLFYCIPVFCNDGLFIDYQKAFLKLFQERDETSIHSFYSIVTKLIKSSKDTQFKDALYPILQSRDIIQEILIGVDNYHLDLTLSGFINLIDYWGRLSKNTFDAFIDKSKPLEHFKFYIEKVKKINIEQEIGADRRTLCLPLKLKNLIFCDSKSHETVQIADIVAGSANHYFRSLANPKFEDELSKKIGKTTLPKLINNSVWPQLNVTPEELGIKDNGKENVLESIIKLTSFKQN